MTTSPESNEVQPSLSSSLELQPNSSGGLKQLIQHLSIGTKISYGYALSLGILVLGTMAGLKIANYYEYQAKLIEEDVQEEVRFLTRLQVGSQRLLLHQQEFVAFEKTPDFWQEESSHIAVHLAEFEQLWSEYQSSQGYTKDSKIREFEDEVKAIETFLQTYEGAPEAYVQQVREIMKQTASYTWSPEEIKAVKKMFLQFNENPVFNRFDSFAHAMDDLIEIAYEEYEQAKAYERTADAIQAIVIITSTLLSLSIASLLASYTSQAIARPMRAVTAVAQQVTTEANFDLQAPVTTNDEVGVLATTLNQLILKVRFLLKEQDALTQAQLNSEKKLRQVIDLVPHLIFARNKDGQLILANQALADVYGTTVEELLNRKAEDFARSPEEDRQFRDDDLQVIESGQPKYIPEEPLTDVQGTTRILQTTKIPFFIADSDEPAVLGVSTNITARKQAELALQESERKLRQVIDLVPHFIFAKNIDGQFILANQAIAQAYGISVEELLTHKDEDFAKSIDEARQFREDDLQVINSGQLRHIPEEPITDSQGQVRLLQTTKFPSLSRVQTRQRFWGLRLTSQSASRQSGNFNNRKSPFALSTKWLQLPNSTLSNVCKVSWQWDGGSSVLRLGRSDRFKESNTR